MADDINIIELPADSVPDETDQLLLIGSTEEKLIYFKKLADAILNELTSKTYTSDVGTKTLIEAINSLNGNKVDKNGITLDKSTDGLIYIFINGKAVGNGVEVTGEIIEGDVVGTLDENNNILLSGNLANGTYTLKYENEDGTYTEVGTIEIGEIVAEPTNLFVVGGDGYILNGRCSSTGANRADSNGLIVSNYIDIKNGDTVYIKNATIYQSSSCYTGIKLTDSSTIGVFPNSSEYIKNYSESGGITQFTINKEDADYIRICLSISYGNEITDSDVTNAGIIITVNEPLS
ncbi:MAG: hypothetical protein IJZ34_11020 [Lachnospiraceae bacterium]|nr:hypothetical protein [Lachnospiraceae bacterium]